MSNGKEHIPKYEETQEVVPVYEETTPVKKKVGAEELPTGAEPSVSEAPSIERPEPVQPTPKWNYFTQKVEPTESDKLTKEIVKWEKEKTKLTPEQEERFQKFMQFHPDVIAWKKQFKREYGYEPEIDKANYDYRGAWKAAVKNRNIHPLKSGEKAYRWPSIGLEGKMLKSPTHPTRKLTEKPTELIKHIVPQADEQAYKEGYDYVQARAATTATALPPINLQILPEEVPKPPERPTIQPAGEPITPELREAKEAWQEHEEWKESVAEKLPYVIKAGYNQSLIGTTQQILSGEKTFKVEDYDPSTLEEIAAIGFGFSLDIPFFTVTGGAGGLAVKATIQKGIQIAGKQYLKNLLKIGVERELAEQMVKTGMKVNTAKIAKFAGMAEASGASASALGNYGAAHEAMYQITEEGRSIGELDYKRIAKEELIGGALGGTLGIAGYGTGLLNATIRQSGLSAMSKTAALYGTKAAGFTGEVGIFTLGDRFFRGHDLSSITPEDWANSVKMVLGARAAHLPTMAREYIKGKKGEVTLSKRELEALDSKSKEEVIEKTKDMTNEELINFLKDPNIPLATKDKVLYETKGLYPENRQEIRDVSATEQGDKTVVSIKNEKGMLLDTKEYKDKAQAEADALKLIDIAKDNELLDKLERLDINQKHDIIEKAGDTEAVKEALMKPQRTPEEKELINKFRDVIDETLKKPEAKPEEPKPEEEIEKRERLAHQIRKSEDTTTLNDMTKGGDLIPTDFYTNPEYYADLKMQTYKESWEVIKKAKGNPEATVTVYRAVPKGVDKIEAGDWISLSELYAKEHGMHPTDASKDLPVISMRVKVKDVVWDGNDINEFAYFPTKKEKTELKKFTTTTEEKYGYIQEAGKEKRDLTREEFEAEQVKPEEILPHRIETVQEKLNAGEELTRAEQVYVRQFNLEKDKPIPKNAQEIIKAHKEYKKVIAKIKSEFPKEKEGATELTKQYREGKITKYAFLDGLIEEKTGRKIKKPPEKEAKELIGRYERGELDTNEFLDKYMPFAKEDLRGAKLEIEKNEMVLIDKEGKEIERAKLTPEELSLSKEIVKQYEEKEPTKAEEPTETKPEETPEYKEHITTGTKKQRGKYQVEKVGDEVKILNVDTGKTVKQTKQNQWAIDQYVDVNIKKLRSGKKADIPEGATPEDVSRIIAKESQNPEEVATEWLSLKDAKTAETSFEEAVYIAARDIDTDDFTRYTGYKFTGEKRPQTKEVPHLTGRFKKGGKGLDEIAERVNEIMEVPEEMAEAVAEERKTKQEETVERIIDTLISKEFKDYKPGKETQTEIDLADRFRDITGLELTETTAKKVTDYRSKAEKWADEIDEFIKDLPETGVPFFIAPKLLKFALEIVSKALKAEIMLSRAIKLAIIKTREKMKKERLDEKEFDEKEFRKFVKKEIGLTFPKIKLPKGTGVKRKIEETTGIKRKKPIETLTTKQYYRFADKMGRLGEKATKKATDQMQKEVISFVKNNINDLKRVSGRSVSTLMKKIADVRAGKPKALETAINYINKVATGQAEKDRLEGIEAVRKKIDNELKQATKKELGRIKAKRYSQEGIDAIKAIKESFDLSGEQASTKAAELESKIAAEEAHKNQDLTDTQKKEVEENIIKLQKQAEYVNLYSDLNNKSQEGINHINELLKQELADLKEIIKEKRKERGERWKAKKEKFFEGIGRPTETELEETPKKPTVWAAYLAKQLNPKNLLTQLAGKEGEAHAKQLEIGTEKYVSTELKMKKRIKEKIKESFGNELKMRKELNKKTEIGLTEEVKDKKGNIIEVRRVTKKIDHANLVHLWASYMSEANNIYTQRIADVNRRLKLTPEEWLRIDELLPDNIKNFTEWIIKDFLPSYHSQANDVYYRRNFVNLPKLPDYLFVNAKRTRDATAALTDIYRVSTYKPFTTQRIYGEYNLRGNNIYEGLLNHVEQHSKFVGLSEPIGDVNSLINSKEISRLIEQRGLQPYKRSLEHMMTVGIVGDKKFKADWLFHNFVGSKVLMNFALFPKQTVSFFASLDPKYAPTREVIKSIYNINTNRKAFKRATNILSQSGQFSTRNIKEIETHIKKGNPHKAQLIIDEIADKMENKEAGKSIKSIGEFLWNPTQKGDRFTIRLGGIPLIDAVYRTERKQLIEKGEKIEDAEKMAASEALYKFNEWMNDTQQSMRWTGKSEFQTGLYRYGAPFMNSLMSYSRKIITSYRDIYRDVKGKRERLLKENPNMNTHVATIKSLSGVKGADLQRIFIYQMALPVLWSAVSSGGRSIINLWNDDEEKRKLAWKDLVWNMTFAWTKGLYVIGFAGNYFYSHATERKYGRQADNFIRLFDDIIGVVTSTTDVITGNIKLTKAETDKEYEKQKARVLKAYLKSGEYLIATVGLPSVAVKRTADIITDDFYDNKLKKTLRLYGIKEKDIKDWFLFDTEKNELKELMEKRAKPKEEKTEEEKEAAKAKSKAKEEELKKAAKKYGIEYIPKKKEQNKKPFKKQTYKHGF